MCAVDAHIVLLMIFAGFYAKKFVNIIYGTRVYTCMANVNRELVQVLGFMETFCLSVRVLTFGIMES